MGKSRRFAAQTIALLGLMLGGSAAPALAQDRGSSVTDREQRNLSDLGIRFGSFVFTPSMALEGRHDDNIFATDRDRRGDFYATVRPELTLRSDFGRNALNARAYYDRDLHAKYTTENVSQYGGGADGRYELGSDTSLSARFGYDRLAESRGSLGTFQGTTRPAQFTSLEGEGTATQSFRSLALSLGGRVRRLRYADALVGGTPVDQRYRDLTIGSGTLTASYGFHELTRLVVVAEIERRRYALRPGDAGFDPLTSTDRSADGFRIEAGVAREITALITGTLRIGYLRYDYADPRLRDIAGFAYSGDLRWNPSGLTTITAAASRRLDETSSPVTAGNLRDEFSLGVDHELLRRLILSADVRYASIKPSNLFADSTEFGAGLGARYYVGRNLRLNAELRRSQRRSTDRSIAFRSNVLLIGARFTR